MLAIYALSISRDITLIKIPGTSTHVLNCFALVAISSGIMRAVTSLHG